jgi:hypothetical protein
MRAAPIVPDDASDLVVTERTGESEHIAHAIEHRIGEQIVVERYGCGRSATVAAQVGGDDVKPHRRERQKLMSPGVGELRKAVQQNEAAPSRSFESGLEQVHSEAVVVVNVA